jgi:hypothetical protein
MKNKQAMRYILLIIISFISQRMFPQIKNVGIERTMEYTNYFIDNKPVYLINYKLRNVADEDYWIWFDNTNIENRTSKELIRKHFFSRDGDFILCQIALDFNIESYSPDLLSNFTKEIKPKSQFMISFYAKDVADTTIVRDYMKEHLVIIEKQKILRYIKNADSFNSKIFFSLDNMLILYEQLYSLVKSSIKDK